MQLTKQYPQIEILQNHDEPRNILENFDVYIRGVGPISQRDEQDRIYLFRKKGPLDKFVLHFNRSMVEVSDRLGIIIMGYGDTNELQIAQDGFRNSHKGLYKRAERCKEFCKDIVLANDEDYAKVDHQFETEKKTIPLGQKMQCRNWGCS